MESVNNSLEDNSLSDTEKLEKAVKLLMNTKLEGDQENINILKCVAISNLEENIEHLIGLFRKAVSSSKNHKPLAKSLEFIFKLCEDHDEIQTIMSQLGLEDIHKAILRDLFIENSSEEIASILTSFFKYSSVDHQVIFFNYIFQLSEIHQNVQVLYVTLKNIDQAALTHDSSIMLAKNFWIYLTNRLANCKKKEDTKITISVLKFCINLIKNEKLELKFASLAGAEHTWNAFFTIIHVFSHMLRELIKPSLQLIAYLSPLDYFWQHCVYEIVINRAPFNVKCEVLASILKQIQHENMRIFSKLILSAINEQKCNNEQCPALTELRIFCENRQVTNLPIILDDFLNICWNVELVWRVLGSVLVDSRKNLVEFEYFTRILRHLQSYEFIPYPASEVNQLSTFFYDKENLDYWREITGSSIPFSMCNLPVSEKLENVAISKLVELSDRESDDILEIRTYLGFLKENIEITDVIKDYPVNIHVRMAIYRQLFTINGYMIAETKLDQDKTVYDFHDYLLNCLNERTYLVYREVMLIFLELNGRFMNFTYPEKACSEFLNIILNPELYTKHQICCSTEVLRYAYYRFIDLCNPNNSDIYVKIAQKWKPLILETEDPEICKQGLYFVLEKGRPSDNEHFEIVQELLEKHICDCVTEEIYNSYLNADLMNIALIRLKYIGEYNSKQCERFSKLFCRAVVSGKYVNDNQFSCENEEFKFCCSDSKNLEESIREVNFSLLQSLEYKNCRGKSVDLIIEIYLNKLINIDTKVYCLHVLLNITAMHGYPRMHPPCLKYFVEDVKWIMNKFKEKYAANSKNNDIKLRIVQGLFLLIPYVMRDFDKKYKTVMILAKKNIYKKLRAKLKIITVGILVKEADNQNNPVRQICQHMYILLFENDGTFEEIKSILEKVKEQPNLANSFMPVLYHVMSFCKFSRDEVEEMCASMFFLSQFPEDRVRLYAQVVLQHFYILYNTKVRKNHIEKYIVKLQQVNLDIESNIKEIADILKSDFLFLKVLDPLRDNSVETILYILPKLNEVDSREWENVMKLELLWNAGIANFIIEKDKAETLKKAVEEYLEPQVRAQYLANAKYGDYSAEDILKMFSTPSENDKYLLS